MIFEDAHWADPTSLEAFGRAVNRIAALPVLLAGRYRTGASLGRGAIAQGLRQAAQLLLFQRQNEFFFVGLHMLAELGGKQRQPGADLRQTVAIFAFKLCARPHEVQVIALQHPKCLRPEAQIGTLAFIEFCHFNAVKQVAAIIGIIE